MKSNIKKTNTLTFKIWLYFVAFAISLFIILWFMQVIFLQSYYSTMKQNEVKKLVSQIEKEYLEGNYIDEIDNIAYKNVSSIFIFNENGNTIYSSNTGSSLQGQVSQMPSRPISIDTTGVVEKILKSPTKKIDYTIKVDRFKTELYVYGKKIPSTEACVVMISSIDPIDATTKVIQSQLIYITIIALLIASIISIFISKRLSKPISKINETAKKLAHGNYDVNFEKSGYKELDDLADTLNYATEELGKTDKIRKELIANVSHDLRTPLTMIKAYSEMIRDLSGDNKEKREEHLAVIINETERLARLVDDMMDLSKIESGMTILTKSIFNISEVTKNIVNTLQVVNKDNTACKFIVEASDEIFVNADKTKIEQVLYNLITNAVKHSLDNKEIKIKIYINNKKVMTKVIDNGPGISKKDLPYIWNRYYKSNNTFNRPTTGGSGLGLSIVKNILDKHRSEYGVESTIGKGTTFYFELDKASKKGFKEQEKLENVEQIKK